MARDAKIPSLMNELAHLPKTMQGVELGDSFGTIVFSVKDNRKSEGRRLVKYYYYSDKPNPYI